MDALFSAILPIECFDRLLLKTAISELVSLNIICIHNSEEKYAKFVSDIDHNCSEYYCASDKDIDVFIFESGTCLLLLLNWNISEVDYYSLVNRIFYLRNYIVKEIILNQYTNENIRSILSTFKKFGLNWYYSFSFTSISDCDFNDNNALHAKILAEPSIIDADDMNCSVTKISYSENTNINDEIAKCVVDVDLSSNICSYITWATIVSISKNNTYKNNHILLVLLELNVQRTWNQCYSYSKKIDEIISGDYSKRLDIDSFKVKTYNILTNSKRAISASYSSRIDVLFKNISDSSKLNQQIVNLEQKLSYLEEYYNCKMRKENKRIQQITDILLYTIAMSQLVQLFIPLPIVNNTYAGVVIITLFTIIGFVFIIIKKY